MSVKSQNKIWNGVAVEQRINLDTGQMEVYTIPKSSFGNPIGPPVKLAETVQDGTKNKWVIDKSQVSIYKTLINQSGTKNYKNDKEFLKDFNNSLAPSFNLNRALVLNDNDNYSTQQIAIANRKKFFNLNIPLTVSPTTGIVVSSNGVKSTQQLTGQQQVTTNNGGANNGGGNGLPTLGDGETNFNFDGVSTDRERFNEAKQYGEERGGKRVEYRYPKQIPEGFEYDYISITAHDYVASGLDVMAKNNGGDEYFVADKNLGPAYETVIFPMQPQLSETNAVNWSDDQLNPVQAMFGNAAINFIDNTANFDLVGIQNTFNTIIDNAKTALKDDATKRAIAAYFAGQAVGANLQGRLTGQVINPNLELLFNGPNLRTFNFNFRLTPRTESESQEIRKIIRCFKRNMAVQRTTSNIFLRSPRIFKLVYIYKDGGQHPYLNKFKPCAMSNFQVNYTPDGSYATFDKTGSLTAYDLTMSFSEIMPIYSNDFDINDDNPTDMGF
jgi:hypothetical protein